MKIRNNSEKYPEIIDTRKRICEKCEKVHDGTFGSGIFCSRSCSNSRNHSKENREKIRNTLLEKSPLPKEIVLFCYSCGKDFSPKNRNINQQCCSRRCSMLLRHQEYLEEQREYILNSCKIQNKRSKNEIYFSELCQEYFGSDKVLMNEKMFDGWDADIILPHLKLAVLWNGIWHYQKVRESHSLEQVQSRDHIKEKIIQKCGYTPIIIKDMGKYNKKFVEEQFDQFIFIFNINLINID